MNISRIAILGVALIAGAAAFFLMMGNNSGQTPMQIVEPVKEETVRVLVSAGDIPRGGRLTADGTQWVAWPKKAVQPTFITDETPEARDNLANAVARSLIVAGEPIVEAKVVRAGSSGLMAALLSPGMRAVTMRVSPETASGGFILPGDRVDIHYSQADRNNNNKTKITTIKENVRVLAVNTIYAENPESPVIEGKTVTLEMTPADAETFMIAQNSSGTLQLTLRSIFEPSESVAQQNNAQSEIKVIRYGRS